MALSISELNAVSQKYYDKTLKQIVYEDSPLYVRLKQKNHVKVSGGSQIQFPVRYRKYGRADAIAPRQQLSFEEKDTRTGGVLDWKYYEVDTMLQWDERVKNAGKGQIIDLMKDKLTELKEDMYDRFATDLFSTNDNGLGISPLSEIVDATVSYAGVAPSDATQWASTESASVTLTLYSGANSLAYMVAQATFGKAAPDLHITTRDLQNKFESLMASNIRYEDTEMANAGFRNITFRGAPVIGDAHCPSKAWYGLDTNSLELVVHSDYNFEMTPWQELTPVGFPNAVVRIMSWAGNMKCTNRRTQFKYTALVYTN